MVRNRILNRFLFVQPVRCAPGAPFLDDCEVLITLSAGVNATTYLVREKHTYHLYDL